MLSLRSFLKNKLSSFTIILSLVAGLTIINLVIGFVVREYQTDRFHINKDRIFRLTSTDPFGRSSNISYMQRELPQYMANHYPELEDVALVNNVRNNGLKVKANDDPIEGLVLLAVDRSFFKIFNLPSGSGLVEQPLDQGQVMLTSKTAEQLFGKSIPLGETVTILQDTLELDFIVKGITPGFRKNSHLFFDGILLIDDFKNINGGICYALLAKGTDPLEAVEKINKDSQMPSLIGPGKGIYQFQPLPDIYFDIQNTRNFSKARSRSFLEIGVAVALIVLVLAGFNFVSLLSFSLVDRWKEFGIRKILGAGIKAIAMSATVEAVFYIGLSYLFSILLARMLLPWFNQFTSSNLAIRHYYDPATAAVLSIMLLLMALLTIWRITAYLNKVNPLDLLSGRRRGSLSFNRMIMIVQLMITTVLIFGAIVVTRQISLIKEKPLGFNRNIIEVRLPNNISAVKKNSYLQSLKGYDGFISVTLCSGNPISDNIIFRYDLEDGTFYTPYYFEGDEQYLNTLGLKLISGKIPSPQSNGKLVNEAFIDYFAFEDPLGKRIPGSEHDFIEGIISNYHISSLRQEIPPAILSINEESNMVLVLYAPDKLAKVRDHMQDMWHAQFPYYPFKYLIIDDELIRNHRDDFLFSQLVTGSCLISILISCMGLFAISWGKTRNRTREFGIRKVIGASSMSIMLLISYEMLLNILIAFIISIPVAYVLALKWLNNFAFKIELSPELFILAGIMIALVSVITISYHAIRSAMVNPVNELRHE